MNSPWLTIWTAPRDTIREIVAKNPNQYIWIFAVIGGFPNALFSMMGLFPDLNPMARILISLALAPIIGMILLTINSWFYLQIGKIFKGKGDLLSVRAAIAWSYIPVILIIPVLIWIQPIFNDFIAGADSSALMDKLIAETLIWLIITWLACLVFGVWGLVIQIAGLSVVQRFSIASAIGNFILANVAITFAWTIAKWLVKIVII
jgi:hypothetical protein